MPTPLEERAPQAPTLMRTDSSAQQPTIEPTSERIAPREFGASPIAGAPVMTLPATGAVLGSPPAQPAEAPRSLEVDRRAIAAAVLIVIGLLLLIGNLSTSTLVGLLILPSLGAIFLAWGFLARLTGPLIPGGILAGLGLGVLVQQLFLTADAPVGGAVVVMGLGLGFLVITPLVFLVTGKRCWWPLIPGGILAIIGIALLLGSAGLAFLRVLGQLWPVILIAVGVYLLWRATDRRGART